MNKFLLAVEIDEKGHNDRDLTFEEKRQDALENTSNAKNDYGLDYDVGNIETFMDEFKNKKIKKLEDKIQELEDKNKNSTTDQITNNFGKIIIKN